MCHIGGVETGALMSQILDLLRPKDILTHCYSGAPNLSNQFTIYDISGRLVATVVGEDRSAGAQRLMWNARAASGARVASGVYLGRLSTPDGETTVKVVRLD